MRSFTQVTASALFVLSFCSLLPSFASANVSSNPYTVEVTCTEASYESATCTYKAPTPGYTLETVELSFSETLDVQALFPPSTSGQMSITSQVSGSATTHVSDQMVMDNGPGGTEDEIMPLPVAYTENVTSEFLSGNGVVDISTQLVTSTPHFSVTGDSGLDTTMLLTFAAVGGTVPEPGSIALLGLGMLAFVVIHRRRASR